LLEAKAKGEIGYFPEELLYLKNGLYIWSQLVHRPKYYQTHDEISLFRKNGKEIASYIAPNGTLVDLGSGCVQNDYFYNLPLLPRDTNRPTEK